VAVVSADRNSVAARPRERPGSVGLARRRATRGRGDRRRNSRRPWGDSRGQRGLPRSRDSRRGDRCGDSRLGLRRRPPRRSAVVRGRRASLRVLAAPGASSASASPDNATVGARQPSRARATAGAASASVPPSRPNSTSPALGRASGSFRNARRTSSIIPAGRPDSPDRSGSSCSVRCTTTSGAPSPKGGRPVAANISTPAQANTSAAAPTRSPSACSGAMYRACRSRWRHRRPAGLSRARSRCQNRSSVAPQDATEHSRSPPAAADRPHRSMVDTPVRTRAGLATRVGTRGRPIARGLVALLRPST
jgi:hypothetical protein